MTIHRRALLIAALGLPLTARAQSGPPILRACISATPADMEGPFYKPGAPARASLREAASKAPKLVLTGHVLHRECAPLAGARLDFWHADDAGEYDHAGFRYRGIVVADAEGRYRLETNLPPPYMGRPRHIHVKLQRAGGRALTTQLYFPGESRGADPALVVKMEKSGSALEARYDFVLTA